MKLILASRSAARRSMLEAAGVPFDAIRAELDEDEAKARLWAAGCDARDLAQQLARLKALSVAADAGNLVLGSDQTLERDDGTILSKPASREEAWGQLTSLRGGTHRLHSAGAIAEEGEIVWAGAETVTLTMRQFTDAFLEAYLDLEYEAIRGSVGCYRIEGPGVQLFKSIAGSHFAILGMPLLPLLAYLREREVIGV
ncbi:Maf family protein [Allosphingosinicella sp.]|jgi:septum formation protein|uniref:Maf family protein n=1 Tax=Allosphingosinicella sp. TaxID=2823234 RepID=UPI002F0E8C82